MAVIEELGRRFVQRSWFERQFVHNGNELRFHDGPLRSVRAARNDERNEYIELAMRHAIAVAGWTQAVLLPLGMISVPFLLSLRWMAPGLLIDIAIGWCIIRYMPDIRAKRRRVRSLVERWPVVAPASIRSYFKVFWTTESFAKTGARERRVLFWTGLFFTAGGILLVLVQSGIGWFGLARGLMSLIVATLAHRAA